jgi:hypothetical protein
MGDDTGSVAEKAPVADGDSKPRRRRNRNRNKSAASTVGRAATVTSNTAATVRQAGFIGKCPDLEGHIYDCTDSRQSDIFTKTTKEIAEYVGTNFKNGGDVRLAVELLEMPTLTRPTAAVPDKDGKVDDMSKLIAEKMVNEYVRQLTTLHQNIRTLYSLVWGQCTDAMRQRVEALKEYDKVHSELNGLELLKLIKNQAFNFSSQKNWKHALHESTRKFYGLTQGKSTTTQDYFQVF